MKNAFLKTLVCKSRLLLTSHLFVSFVSLCAGFLLIAFKSGIIHILLVTCGILLFALALYHLMRHPQGGKSPLSSYLPSRVAILLLPLALGVILFSSHILAFVERLIGLYLLLYNTRVLYRLFFVQNRARRIWLSRVLHVVALIFSCALVLAPTDTADLLALLLGLALAYQGISSLALTLSARKRANGNYIEPEFRDKT